MIQFRRDFEKYFDIVGANQAEKVACGMEEMIVTKNKEQILMDIDLKKIKEKGEIMFKDG
ncbi:hypothetical protein ACQKFG_17270 [Peribacillus sp. NPDC076916]|uniref:hypothetical protein n=1 Tax=Peribacillus sp. NPDC076916 TaxID=3390608 RepID=UPI003D014FC9